MTRVDFYVLPSSEPQPRRILACKLAEKAWRLGMKIYVHTGSDAEDRIMDDLLWTFRQGSFIPHTLASAPADDRADVPVAIGHASPPPDFADLLINLSADAPPEIERFTRVAELVDQDETVRDKGRQRYRQYRERGLELETHNLDAA
ncbi:MAG: polymerase chi subunit superfamily protein [Proteobacteria bacterium]|nr:polymerase chi subunit superfamily protein [Pseudomonadota bacterium]